MAIIIFGLTSSYSCRRAAYAQLTVKRHRNQNKMQSSVAMCSACTIQDLVLHKKYIFVTGLIIAKGEKKVFNGRANGQMKAVITITIRDTKDHFINCTIWGSENYVDNCVNAYKIGDIIVINRPTVQQASSVNQYAPKTTSPFNLQFSEDKGMIYREDPHNFPYLMELRHRAIKSTSLALNLVDLVALPDTQRTYVDLIVIVQTIEPTQSIRTKNGLKSKRRALMMDTTKHSMPLVIWSPEYQQMADKWIPMQTILHLVDVIFEYSEYDRSHILTLNSRSILMVNPIRSVRSNSLLAHIYGLAPAEFDQLKGVPAKVNAIDAVDLDTVTEVMTIGKMLRLIREGAGTDFPVKFYGVITKFDIDSGAGRDPIIKCCVHCDRYLVKNQKCDNVYCIPKLGNGRDYVEKYSVTLNVSDHSGTLVNCRISDEYASNLFGCSAREFKQLPDSRIDDIKNAYYLERVVIKMIVKPKNRNDYAVSVLYIGSESPYTMATQMKIY